MRLYVQDSIILRDFSDAELGSTIPPPPPPNFGVYIRISNWMQGMDRPYAITRMKSIRSGAQLPKVISRFSSTTASNSFLSSTNAHGTQSRWYTTQAYPLVCGRRS